MKPFFYLITLIALCLSYIKTPYAAQAADKLTVAYIYQVSKFTRWSPEVFPQPEDKIEICYINEKPDPLFLTLFKKIEQQTSQKRKIKTVAMTQLSQIKDTHTHCHIIYLPTTTWQKLTPSEREVLNQHRLIISDSKKFLQQKGMLALIPMAGKLTIFVNPITIKNSDIKLEARLMTLAKKVAL